MRGIVANSGWLQRLVRDLGRVPRDLMIAGSVGAAAAVAALFAVIPLAVERAAAVEVRGVTFALPPQGQRLLATISIENIGALPATVIGSNNAFILTAKEMTSEEENREWDHLGEVAANDAPRSLEPGGRWPDYAVVRTLERKEYQAFLSGAALIYFLMRTQYRDASLPAGRHRITETCYYYSKDPQQRRSCHGHNRRYVSD